MVEWSSILPLGCGGDALPKLQFRESRDHEILRQRGRPLTRRCDTCGTENPLHFKFCGECGTALAANAVSAATSSTQGASAATEILVTARQPVASTSADGERKTVTALFADIKGSTELMRDLDPE